MTQQYIRHNVNLEAVSNSSSYSVNTDIDTVMIMDIETTSDFSQHCRVGYYIVKRLSTDTILDCGIIYDTLLPEEKDTLDQYSIDALKHLENLAIEMKSTAYDYIINWYKSHDMRILTLKQFVEQRMYPCLLNGVALINHNIPFDLGAIASSFYPVGDDGFSFKFCNCISRSCSLHPNIITKRLSGKKVSIHVDTDQDNVGCIMDTIILGTALLGPGDGSLKGMGSRFRCDIQKSDTDEHGQILTNEYITYMINDVLATLDLFEKQMAIYKKHELNMPMNHLFSVASLGKGYYDKFGIPPFKEQHPNVPSWVYKVANKTFYGARSEVKMRLMPVEIRYCDFKSQYTTANALLGLQDLLIAEYITVENCISKAQKIIDRITVQDLQNPKLWKQLRILVKIKPNDDILPTRWEKDGKRAYGVCYSKGPENWYTLCDVVASKLLTGKTIKIFQAIELVPHGRIETTPVRFFNDPNYEIDLKVHDLFVKLIDMRSEVKVERDAYDENADEYHYYSSLEQALKVLASATSYGILVETKMMQGYEVAGKYFVSPVGTHIIGAARLMLAIAERLGCDRGLDYAMCDTDSMAFFRPTNMDKGVFRTLVTEICEWFLPLSPYAKDKKGNIPELFELEEVNYITGKKLIAQIEKQGIDHTNVDDTLYLLGVSCKRYCLYNKLPNGQLLMRKISAHATGRYQFDYDLPLPSNIIETSDDIFIKEDCDDINENDENEDDEITIVDVSGKWKKYQYIMWYRAVQIAENSHIPYVPVEEWSKNMVRYQESISTPSKLNSHSFINGIRPYAFLTETSTQDVPSKRAKSGYVKAKYRYYMPFAKSARELENGLVYRTVTGEQDKSPTFEPLYHRFKDFFNNPERKADNQYEMGIMKRSHVVIDNIVDINRTGKKMMKGDDIDE